MAPSPRRSSRKDANTLPSMSSTFWAIMILASLLIAYCNEFNTLQIYRDIILFGFQRYSDRHMTSRNCKELLFADVKDPLKIILLIFMFVREIQNS